MFFKMSRMKYNGPERNQHFSLSQMEEFESEMPEIPGLFNPEDMCGTWYNDLHLSVLIFKSHSLFKVAILTVDTAGMVIPEIAPLEKDSTSYFICCSLGKIRITFEDRLGRLDFECLGCFSRY